MDNIGQLTCWGDSSDNVPEGSFVRISNGNNHQCAISTEGEVLCWGYISGTPFGKNRKFIDIDSGDYHTCALDIWGQVTGWK